MANSRVRRKLAAYWIMAGVITVAFGTAHAEEKTVPRSTPVGITLVDVVLTSSYTQAEYLWTRLGDEQGRPLFFRVDQSSSSQAACDETCAEEFPPVYAVSGAQTFSDWSLIVGPNSAKQWGYQGKALHRYPAADSRFESSNERQNATAAGDTQADADLEETDNTESKKFSPAEGWRIAAYEPLKSMLLPYGMDLKEVMGANGYALVDTTNGLTLYAANHEELTCNQGASCFDGWQPVHAPRMAVPVGEFSIVRGLDGSPQWAFRDEPLFRFDGDYAPGDANGIGADRRMTVARVNRHFMPPSVQISKTPGRDYILTTDEGMSLYERHQYDYWWGGRTSHQGFRTAYQNGKALGLKGCDDLCLKEWRPFEAPEDARPSGGYWEVATRSDGSKQWVYRGHVLYTYVNDRKPGDVNGSNLTDIVVGDTGRYSLSEVGGGRESGAGLYWHVVHPY